LLFRNSRRVVRPVFEAELARFQEVLWRRGLERRPGETPAQLAERAAARWPRQAEQIRALYRALAVLVYATDSKDLDESRLRRELRRRLRGLQLSA
jgi:hypothetical protein